MNKYFLLLIIFLSSCKNKENTTKLQVISNNDNIQITEKVANLRAFGKDICSGKIQPSDDENTFNCLDSISNSEKQTRVFYFSIFKCISKKSDGALSEYIGGVVKDYFENYPLEAMENYLKMEDKEKEDFSFHLSFELALSSEEAIQKTCKTYFGNIEKNNTSLLNNVKYRFLKENVIKEAIEIYKAN